MNELKQMALSAYVKADMAKDRAKKEITELATNEVGVSGIVVSLLLIAIAVVLAIAFRDRIADFMDQIFGDAETAAGGLTDDVTFGTG